MKTKGLKQSKNIERMLPGMKAERTKDSFKGSPGKSPVFGKLKSSFDGQYKAAQKRSQGDALFTMGKEPKNNALRQVFRPDASHKITKMANSVARRADPLTTRGPGALKMRDVSPPAKNPKGTFGLKPVQAREKAPRKPVY